MTFLLFLSFMATNLFSNNKTSDSWVNDWSEFVKQLSVEINKDKKGNHYIDNVNKAFNGQTVHWRGKVTEIKQPVKTNDSGIIRLSMAPQPFTALSDGMSLDSLTLTPKGDEWDSWKRVSVGSTIVFITTLDKGSIGVCVIDHWKGVGTEAGKGFTVINTKGGKCLKVIVGEDLSPAVLEGSKPILTEREIFDIGTIYYNILQTKNKLYTLIGSKPLGKFNADGLDITKGETKLSGNYNKFITLSMLVNAAGDFCPQDKVNEYNSLVEELKNKGVMPLIKKIQDDQDELASKIDVIQKRGIIIKNPEAVYISFLKLKSKKKGDVRSKN
jgi:hypothetical protein